MEAFVLDQTYETLDIIDAFESFIWTDRFLGYGDFEIYMPAGKGFPAAVSQDNYLSQRNSDRYMIIEQLETGTDAETGTHLIISGRSLESLLERRIIWGQKILTGNFQNGIQTLLNESIISPTISARRIPNFTFRASTDPAITSLTIDAQFIGDNLYDAVFVLCEDKNIGFRVLPNGSGGFVFELYSGVNRSYGQDTRPYVIFSPKFENLIASNYLESKKALKNSALVGGEGEGSDKVLVEVSGNGGGTGLNRREVFVEATGVSSRTDDGDLPEAEYKAQLAAKGQEALAETRNVKSFEGEIDATRQFIYGVDFTIGDIVQVVNEFGMEAQSRVSELIQTHNTEGETFVPTFTTVEND